LSVSVTTINRWEKEYTERDVEQLYAEIEKDVNETKQKEEKNE